MNRRFTISLRALPALFAFIIALFAAACSQSAYDAALTPVRVEVTVLAAASLKEAFLDIGRIAESEDTTIKIVFSFGASNTLARQVEQGAPVDVFASAASNVMDSLDSKGLIIRESRRTFASNSLVVVGGLKSTPITSLNDLSDGRFKRLTVAAPGVPARTYGEEALRKAGVWDQLIGRFVYGDNVRQVVEYVAGGDADAGVVYQTDATQFKDRVRVIFSVPSNLHRPIVYPIAIVKNGRNRPGAEAFLRVLASAKGQEILKRYGFPTPAGQ